MNYDDYLKRLNKAYSEFYTEKRVASHAASIMKGAKRRLVIKSLSAREALILILQQGSAEITIRRK